MAGDVQGILQVVDHRGVQIGGADAADQAAPRALHRLYHVRLGSPDVMTRPRWQGQLGGAVDLYRRLRECGKDVELYLVRGADHGVAEFYTERMVDIYDAFNPPLPCRPSSRWGWSETRPRMTA